ncbi:DUF3762 domain containing protein [Sarcoptes scabiei]|uniref:DUF3762 domain containing protein n=1 Tax=Sarcoptes scabiei TaxID=52283 RepID=A0A132AE82_SARSC|nr:DUF3762 domain containing protein [Sarcoptes scabiei]
MFIVPDFVTEDEEQNLLQEIEDVFVRKRIRYERSHWDDAIHDYREIEHLNWSSKNQSIIERIRLNAFKTNKKHIRFVHILDVTKQGYIKPHVDSVRFCGDTIAGVSLLSDSVMRFRLEKNREIYVDVWLTRRSLYCMRFVRLLFSFKKSLQFPLYDRSSGDARYLYAHEILDERNSKFKNLTVERDHNCVRENLFKFL